MLRYLLRFAALVALGVVLKLILDARAKSSSSSGSAQWPPIKTPTTKAT